MAFHTLPLFFVIFVYLSKNYTTVKIHPNSEDQKHICTEARVHYQKYESREVAVKAHECLQKLQGAKGSVVDKVSTTFGDSLLSLGPSEDEIHLKSKAG